MKRTKIKQINIMTNLIIFAVFFLLVTAMFTYEAKNAPTVPDDAPFLHDDYDPDNDPTLAD
jgi:hypothetical protein